MRNLFLCFYITGSPSVKCWEPFLQKWDYEVLRRNQKGKLFWEIRIWLDRRDLENFARDNHNWPIGVFSASVHYEEEYSLICFKKRVFKRNSLIRVVDTLLLWKLELQMIKNVAKYAFQ